MTWRTWYGALVGLAVLAGAVTPLAAQTAANDRANGGTVGIITGGLDGTYIRIASDLAAVLDDGDDLRVLPVLGKGSVQNIGDILHLRGIDIGIVQSDTLTYIKRERLYPNVDNRIRYIAKLYNEELHLLAGPDIATIEDLAGRKVNFDGSGSGTYMTASLIFDALGVDVEPETFDQSLALEKLKNGEIAALAYVAGKPTRLFQNIDPSSGLHFLPIPMNDDLLQAYLPSRLTNSDYGDIVPPGGDVDTVAVGAVMAVYNWEPDHDRHRKVVNFIDRFFGNFDAFLQPPRHAKWQEVNLQAEVPGWTRFDPAQAWLRQADVALGQADAGGLRDDFEAFVSQRGGSPEQAEALFQQFLTWRSEGQR